MELQLHVLVVDVTVRGPEKRVRHDLAALHGLINTQRDLALAVHGRALGRRHRQHCAARSR